MSTIHGGEAANEELRRIELFEDLDEESLSALQSEMKVIELCDGQRLYSQGEEAGELYCVLNGELELFRDGMDGGDLVLAQIGPGETCAEAVTLPTFTHHDLNARAILGSCRVAAFDSVSVTDLLRRSPCLCLKLIEIYHQRRCLLLDKLEQSSRLAGKFCPLVSSLAGSRSAEMTRFGRYEVLARLGQGGMGVVFRAWDPVLKRQVAIKTLRPALLEGRGRMKLSEFLSQEGALLARFNHTNIVSIHDAGMTTETAFIVMELVRGISLANLIEGRPLGVHHTLHISLALASALAAAHEQQLIHRDVKPANVLLGQDGSVKLTDFGLVGAVNNRSQAGRDESICGTPGFLPPEAFQGEPPGPSWDIYGLGAVLYACLTGVPAFKGRTVREVILSNALGNPPAPIDLQPEVPEDLNKLIVEMLGPDSKARPPAADLSHRLGRLARRHQALPLPAELFEAKKKCGFCPAHLTDTVPLPRRSESRINRRPIPRRPICIPSSSARKKIDTTSRPARGSITFF